MPDNGGPVFAMTADKKTIAVGMAVEATTTTRAYDATSGRVRWGRPGFSPAAAGTTALYLSDRLGTSDCSAGE